MANCLYENRNLRLSVPRLVERKSFSSNWAPTRFVCFRRNYFLFDVATWWTRSIRRRFSFDWIEEKREKCNSSIWFSFSGGIGKLTDGILGDDPENSLTWKKSPVTVDFEFDDLRLFKTIKIYSNREKYRRIEIRFDDFPSIEHRSSLVEIVSNVFIDNIDLDQFGTNFIGKQIQLKFHFDEEQLSLSEITFDNSPLPIRSIERFQPNTTRSNKGFLSTIDCRISIRVFFFSRDSRSFFVHQQLRSDQCFVDRYSVAVVPLVSRQLAMVDDLDNFSDDVVLDSRFHFVFNSARSSTTNVVQTTTLFEKSFDNENDRRFKENFE